MANPIIDSAIAQITTTEGVLDSAVLFIGTTVPALIAKAVADATSNGATAAELAPFGQVTADLKAKSDALAAAIAANPGP